MLVGRVEIMAQCEQCGCNVVDGARLCGGGRCGNRAAPLDDTPPIPAGMLATARAYARRHRLRFRGIVHRQALIGGPTPRALYVDAAGVEHERTIDDLRTEGR